MIKLEMAGDSSSTILVGFFSKHNLVHKAAALWVGGGYPRDFDAAKLPLQHFEQRHEVPHSKDVMFHKQPQGIHAINFGIDTMIEQSVLQRNQSLFDCVKLIQWSFFC